MGRSRRGAPTASPSSVPSSDEEVHSDDEIFREIEDYAVEAEREDHVQVGYPPLYMLASDVRWSEGASSAGAELHPWTLTPNMFVRTRYLGFLLRNWDSSLVNIDWGI